MAGCARGPEHLPPERSAEDAIAALRALAAHAHLQEIHYLWRPFLSDPDDDMVLELAFASSCRYIVTHNPRDFVGASQLGIEIVLPGEFLRLISQL
jgi:predicted nucleic acid-binding protein